MDLLLPRSHVTTDGHGMTWLEPVRRSTRVRQPAGTFILAVLIVVGGATATLLPPAPAAVGTAAVIGAAAAVLWSVVRGAASRVAVTPAGVYVEDGARTSQLAWSAVRGIRGQRAGRRVRITVDDGQRPVTTRASFEVDAARRWLDLASQEAQRRRLEPRPEPDGLGFGT